MKFLVKFARVGDRILELITAFIVMLLLFYGGFSLIDHFMTMNNASADRYSKYKPAETDEFSFEELRKINPDVVAWLKIDDTGIDYPVVKGKDNREYLQKNVFGDFEISGSIFLDYRNESDFSDSYNLLYGHHMENGAMFGDLSDFLDGDFFKKHKTGILYLPKEKYRVAILAVMKVTDTDSYIYSVGNLNDSDMGDLISYIESSATLCRKRKLSKTDNLIAFSTCATGEHNMRTVVIGQLKR